VDGFWMGKYVVTQGEWGKVMPDNPSKFKKGDIYPVEEVSWEHAMQFIRKLNKMNNGKYELRLPTDNAAGRQRISCTAPSDNFRRLLSGL
jgi:formylglycine-generating enzyme required for sulfatase activity